MALTAATIRCRESVPVLLQWLAESDAGGRPFLREVLIDSLERIGDDRALPALQAATAHADEWTRFFAREALARIAGDFAEAAPAWPGARGLRLAVVSASVWSGPVHHFYRDLIREALVDGEYAESYAGWRASGDERILRDLAFDEASTPRYTVLILHALQPEQTTGELMWRLYHYVRRGGRLITDRPSLFWPGEHTVYEPGPWDALFPEQLERHPRFPSIDGIPPPRRLSRHSPTPLKSLYYGYRQIGSGGVLMIARQNRTLAESTREAVPYSVTEGFLEPVSNHVRPVLGVAIPQILHWLTEGPTWKPATVDWRGEPHDVADITAGTPYPLPATDTFHDTVGPLTPRLTVRDPRDEAVVRVTGRSLTGNPGDARVETLSVDLVTLSEKGDYTLELAVTDADGRVIDALLPGVAGQSLRGRRGPTMGAAPDSGLHTAPGLLHGRFGNGLFVYLNVDPDIIQGYPAGDVPLDLAAGVRLIQAVLPLEPGQYELRIRPPADASRAVRAHAADRRRRPDARIGAPAFADQSLGYATDAS